MNSLSSVRITITSVTGPDTGAVMMQRCVICGRREWFWIPFAVRPWMSNCWEVSIRCIGCRKRNPWHK